MALVASIHKGEFMLPDFTLKDSQGEPYPLQAQMGDKGLLVAFTCNHFPYAIAV
jgi:peroxiredoxin